MDKFGITRNIDAVLKRIRAVFLGGKQKPAQPMACYNMKIDQMKRSKCNRLYSFRFGGKLKEACSRPMLTYHSRYSSTRRKDEMHC
jgi:hypothetical protein